MLVPGEGPIPCAFMFVGEYPGIDEVRVGRPFVGKSGREMKRYLNGRNLPEADDVYLTNLRKRPVEKGEDYNLLAEEEVEIWREIRLVQPRVIVTFGAHVTKFFLGPDATLEATYGIPHTGDSINFAAYTDAAPTIFPMYNPAAMLHSPAMQAWFAKGMRLLEAYLKGKLPPAPVDLHKGTYIDISSEGAWSVVGDQIEQFKTLGTDTEGWTWDAWGASISGEPYVGYVAKNKTAGWRRLRDHIRAVKPQVELHNSLHDLSVLRAMDPPLDLDLDEIPFGDTQVRAYLLGLEPQGLKPLAKRHAGMEQDDYLDIVAVPNARIAEQWLHELVDRLPVKVIPPKVTKTRRKKSSNPDDAFDVTVQTTHAVTTYQSDTDKELARVRGLIEKMIAKNEPETLRKRWAACRSREILVDELYYLDPWHADPPDATLDEVDPNVAVRYSGRDADCEIRIVEPLDVQITEMGLRDVYNVDMAIIPMIDRMQTVGLDADLAHFKSLHDLFEVEAELNREAIRALTGRDINPNSGDQVAAYIFDELKLDQLDGAKHMRIKRTDSGKRLSTNDKILEGLSALHPSVPLFQDGREIGKMDGTYARPMVYLIGKDGRLHPRYRLTTTDTGRLSAGDPNVLALPKHSARGKLVRMGFRAGEGMVLSEWDLAQIEMCVFASDSGDERMIAEIASGVDKHKSTAAMLFNKSIDAISGEERFAAKAVNFGILMGITEYGLLDQFHKNKQMHWTLDMTTDLLAMWMKGYPGAARHIDYKHAEARRYGYVRDMWGRLRWLEGIHSVDDYIRAEAERQAQATPTQSGAQGIIKRAMMGLWPILKDFRRQGMKVECLLQVHDALVLEHDPKDAAIINEAVMACMTELVSLKVPIKASSHIGVARLGEL